MNFVLYMFVLAMSIMTIIKQQKSFDKFQDLCSMELQLSSGYRVTVLYGLYKRAQIFSLFSEVVERPGKLKFQYKNVGDLFYLALQILATCVC